MTGMAPRPNLLPDSIAKYPGVRALRVRWGRGECHLRDAGVHFILLGRQGAFLTGVPKVEE
eukprot:3081298-Pyramimonas_sp.AAC.1